MIRRLRNRLAREQRERGRRGADFHPLTTYRDPSDRRFYEPVLVGPSTLANACWSADAAREAIRIVSSLTPDPYADFTLRYYAAGLERFGDRWKYGDILTVLVGICRTFAVQSYMEIGVRRGRSLAVAGAMSPEARMVGFDMWISNYVGIENPGPAFVRQEVERAGFRGSLELISGNSRETVPAYFRAHPDATFDLITVDGDHSSRGAAADLQNVIPRLKIGGALIFDDIANPDHPELKRVWRREVERSDRFRTASFDELGFGVAFAIRQY